jgi:hypothetical protein
MISLVACGGGSEEDPSSASGSVKVTLSSSTLGSSLLISSSGVVRPYVGSGTNCSVTVESTTTTGKCYTPLRVGGFFDSASLSSTMGGLPVRVLGGGDKYHGMQDIFRHEAFNLASPIELEGDDNIQDGTASSYNLLSLRAQALEYQFSAVVGGSTKYYTVRTFFADSKPSESAVLTGCSLTTGELSQADTYGDLYSGISAKRGDIMVCIQSTATAECAASDFKWVDTSGNTYTTRPSTPLQLGGTYFANAPSCSQGSGHAEITWGSSDISASLGTSVAVSAVIDRGTKTYTVGGNSGTQLNVAIDIVATDSLFIPSAATTVTDLSSVSSEAVLLQNLGSILLKPVFKNDSRSQPTDSGDAALNCTISLSVQ